MAVHPNNIEPGGNMRNQHETFRNFNRNGFVALI